MQRIFGWSTKRQSTVGSAAVILMVTVLASRVLGLVRDRLLAGQFTPDELGIYFAAFRIPNMLFELLVMGALTTAFVPVFTRLMTKENEKAAWKMASIVMNFGMILMLLLSIPIILFAVPLSRLLAPGFTEAQIQQMAYFTILMTVFQVFPLMLGNFMTGMLQSYQMFLMPAFAPVVYNVGIIAGIVFFAKTFGLLAPVIGVIIGAFLFFLVQIPPLLVLRYRHKFSLDATSDGVKEVGKLMAPRTFGLAISQIDTNADLILASLLGSKMVTIFNFAQHLQQLPIGLFGATIAQAALPSLSRTSAKDDGGQFIKQLSQAMHQILFFTLPISVFFIILRIPITRLVFGSYDFDWDATVLTGYTLSAFSISLFAQSIIQVLARGFYAMYDSKTPVIVGIIGILSNTILSVVFVVLLKQPVWSLGISTSLASIIQAAILYFILYKRVGHFSFTDTIAIPFKITAASAITGIICFVLYRLFDRLVFDTTRTINVFLLTITICSIGSAMYLFLCWVIGVGQVASMIARMKQMKKLRARILPWTVSVTDDQSPKQMTP